MSRGKPEKQFNSLTMAALNPHTTQKESRTCVDCHTSPKTMGLGEGTLWRENGRWRFTPLALGLETAPGPTPPLDGYVDLTGKALQKSSRANLRPFTGDELNRILRIGLCLDCHKSYDDPAYQGLPSHHQLSGLQGITGPKDATAGNHGLVVDQAW